MDTSTNDLILDFFTPVLAQSVRYDRGVGYFSSGWIRLAAHGLAGLARNGGRGRWITSPILSQDDWEALQAGDAAHRDPILRKVLERNLDDLARDLSRDTLATLAWMVADGILEFRLALPKGRLDGEFHDKFGIFEDADANRVSFNGSYNESIQGTRNYESIKVFVAWEDAFAPLVDSDDKRFERLWANQDPNLTVYELPRAIEERIVRLREKNERPYPPPTGGSANSGIFAFARRLRVPGNLELRDYQEAAVTAWLANHGRGMLEMATGTGKTLTALVGSVRLYQQQRRLAVVIACPYQHLVDQWDGDARGFGYQPVLAYESRRSWLDEVNQQILEYNNGDRPFMAVITTHATFGSDAFQRALGRLEGPAVLIGDEAHHLGSERSRFRLPLTIEHRLALSATPDRWFDDAGTSALRDYFGGTVFSFPLERAINVCLTAYYYYPHVVELTDDEMVIYQELTARIAVLMAREDLDSEERVKALLMKRADLLNRAENKLPMLRSLIEDGAELKHTLFYCAPGQLDRVLEVLGLEKGLLVHRFTYEEGAPERAKLLEDFASGKLHGLVAMHCLDEGVDVPNTRAAYILASSGNPREFIQRRGRILRRAPGKEAAVIHDLIAVPPSGWEQTAAGQPVFETERKIMRRELSRFNEFAGIAINKHQAVEVIWDLARRYGLLDL